MTRTADLRRAPAGVVAGVVAAGLVLAWLLTAAAPALGAPAASAGPVVDRAVFTGTVAGRPERSRTPSGLRFAYRVDVTRVYTDTVIESQRVTVLSRVALGACPSADRGGQGGAGAGGGRSEGGPGASGASGAQGGRSAQPAARVAGRVAAERPLWVFDTDVTASGYRVAGCAAVVPASSAALARLTRRFGEGTVPGPPAPEPDPLDDITYLCPDTREALPDLEATGECRVLDADPPSVNRTLAPGAALVLVGLLGLAVTGRLGRRR